MSISSKHVGFYWLPRPTLIPPGRKTRNRHRSRPEMSCQLLEEHLRFGGPNLVLDRDVRPPAGCVLRNEHVSKTLRQLGAKRDEVGRVDTYGGPASKVHDTGRGRLGAPSPCRLDQAPVKFAHDRGRQMVKHREMGGQHISIGRKVRAPQSVEPVECLPVGENRYDDWSAHDDSTLRALVRCAQLRHERADHHQAGLIPRWTPMPPVAQAKPERSIISSV